MRKLQYFEMSISAGFRPSSSPVRSSWRACSNSYQLLGRFTKLNRFFSFASLHSNFSADRELCPELPDVQDPQTKVPVLIVGAGPVGLSLSILLSKYGIRSLVVERRPALSQHPQAHFINNRTMEIFRKMEGLAEEIESMQPPLDHWRRFVYCNTLAGPVLGTVDHIQPQDLSTLPSPTSIAHFSQHRLLPLLLKRAQKLSSDLITEKGVASDGPLDSPMPGGILLNHELVHIEATPNSITARLLSTNTDSKTLKSLECTYLVATDGAGSSVRRLMNVGMKGEENIQQLVSVHFISKELGEFLLKHHPGMLYFVFNFRAIAVIVAHDLQVGEFIAQIPFYPPQQRFEDFTTAVCRDLIRDVAGMSTLEVEIKTTKQWVMHAQIADTYSCGHGSVILAGDAAHRFPPAGGFGMNTGIQDVHNLAWKLAAVLNGCVSSDFLSTYETERRPIAKANTALSIANFQAATSIPSALGLNPSAARLVQKMVNSGASWLPHGFQSAILDGVFAVGRLQVSDIFLNKYNPLGSSRIARVQQILHQGSSLQLQFPAEDLGFRYSSGALVSEDSDTKLELPKPMGQRREYVPSSSPGSRLPHCPISYLQPDGKSTSEGIISTLDLTSGEIVELLLIVGPSKSGCKWGDAAIHAGKMFATPVKVSIIWPQGTAKKLKIKLSEDENLALTNEEKYVMFEWGRLNKANVVHVEDESASWWSLCGLPSSGAILVRPDDHIAWRATKAADESAAAQLVRVFREVFKKEGDLCDSRPQKW